MRHAMLSLVTGLGLTVGSSLLFWMIRPVDGTPHRLATKPIYETVLPLGITSGLVLGVALIAAGIVSLSQS
jgi:hypothetical protein